MARLAIAKGFLGEYAKPDQDVRPTAEPADQNPQLPFAAWRTFLHPSQREIAYHASYPGPAQVTGGPGTGKTVTVLHRAACLAARVARAEQVLVTTLAGNMAEAMAAQLDLLVRDADVRQKIEVLNVDRLAYHIVRQARGTPVIADERCCATAGPRQPPNALVSPRNPRSATPGRRPC